MVEEVDDAGNGTGRYVAKLAVDVLDPKTKKMVTLELPIDEAIGEMRKDATNANLFLTDGKPGIGGTGSAGQGGKSGVDWSKISAKEHRELRKKM